MWKTAVITQFILCFVCASNFYTANGAHFHKNNAQYKTRTQPYSTSSPYAEKAQRRSSSVLRNPPLKWPDRIRSAIRHSPAGKTSSIRAEQTLPKAPVAQNHEQQDRLLPKCFPSRCTQDRFIPPRCSHTTVLTIHGRKCQSCVFDRCQASVVSDPARFTNLHSNSFTNQLFPSIMTHPRPSSLQNNDRGTGSVPIPLTLTTAQTQIEQSQTPFNRRTSTDMRTTDRETTQSFRDPFSRSIQEQHLAMQNDWFMHDEDFIRSSRNFRASLLLDPITRRRQDFRSSDDATNIMLASDVNPSIISQIGFSQRFMSGQDPSLLIGAPLGDPTVFETVDLPGRGQLRNSDNLAVADDNRFGGLNSWATS